MCGITAFICRQPSYNLAESIQNMTSVVRHRGPDDEGFLLADFATNEFHVASGDDSIDVIQAQHQDVKFHYGKPYTIGFGHRRLSVIDPSPSGHQPMTSSYGKNWITFNGEIYTYRELREELEKLGYNFVTQSDTEVLLNCYHKYGEDVVQYLNGIFSFAIWDVDSKKIFIARDHFGVKPLYYYIDPRHFIIASEIKSIIQVKGVPRILDKEGLDDYLTFRYNPSPNTLLRDIKKVPPGHSLSFDLTSWNEKVERYHQNVPDVISDRSLEEWIDCYSEALVRAVKRQMVADVPIGVLLSGGVDSSLVTAISSSLTSKPFRTFTVGFEEDYLDNEFQEAKEISELYKTNHHEVRINAKEYMDFLSDAGWYMDEPMGSSSSIAMYYLCRRVSEEIKVVLTGQGADEPLAGYARYKAEKYARSLRILLDNKLARGIIERLPRSEQKKRAVRSLGEKDWKTRFVRIYTLFDEHQRRELVNPDYKPKLDRNEEYLEYWVKGLNNITNLNKMLYIDTRMSLPDDLLNYGDKMSMVSSVEARVPILDVDLIDLIESMPHDLKLKGWKKGKYVHKLVAKKWLPPQTINRSKKGFFTPVDKWFQKELSGEISDTLLSQKSLCSEFFSVDYIRQLIESHIQKREDYHRQLFALVFFEFWARRFLN